MLMHGALVLLYSLGAEESTQCNERPRQPSSKRHLHLKRWWKRCYSSLRLLTPLTIPGALRSTHDRRVIVMI